MVFECTVSYLVCLSFVLCCLDELSIFCELIWNDVRTTMSDFEAASLKRSESSKAPLSTFTLGYFSEKDGFGLRSRTVMLYSGWVVTRVLKTVPPTYPVTPVLFHIS